MFLLLAASSSYYARTLTATALAAEASLTRARTDQVATTKMGQMLTRLLSSKAGDPADPVANQVLDVNLSTFVTALMANQVRYGIKIDQLVTTSGQAGQATLKPLASMAQAIAMTGGQSQRAGLRIKGSYQTYAEFKAFIAALHDQPTVLTGMDVTGKAFQLQVSVLGR